MVLDELEPLVANGAPVLVSLRSARVGGTPSRARAQILLVGALPAGAELRVNGFAFVCGELTRSDRFQDAPTLLAALESVPQLVGQYELTQPSGDAVLLVARDEGSLGDLDVSTTAEAQILLDVTDGAPRYRSQLRAEWGVYCEVWAQCGSDFGGQTTKARAVLAQKFEMRYRPDNRYQFDIADALQQYTQHTLTTAPGQIPDRLVSYFVRYGETYADQRGGFRRRRNVYESEVLWALEAVELPSEVAPGVRVLSSAPVERVGTPFQVAYLLLTAAAASELEYWSTETAYNGVTSTIRRDALPGVAPMGGVYCLPFVFDPTKQRSTLGFARSSAPDVEIRTATLDLTTSGRAISFANRQGGFDTVVFLGAQEPALKRSASSYQNAQGEQLRRVELELPVRLTSKLLELEYWNWLRTELGATSSGWVDGRPVTISDLDAQGDPIKAEYSLSVEYKTAPIKGLSN
ncbi:hypothetical protein EU556_11090 [Hymenobacter fodinae]|uniref:Uncharacterized protein n=1 Tax=Hymenobacter fodinae TaxID=2510796 RepID=A0A4Z0P8D2_9BACT|nr:hypothetical protein EU556_11090 [Hymenobacter fodinae]